MEDLKNCWDMQKMTCNCMIEAFFCTETLFGDYADCVWEWVWDQLLSPFLRCVSWTSSSTLRKPSSCWTSSCWGERCRKPAKRMSSRPLPLRIWCKRSVASLFLCVLFFVWFLHLPLWGWCLSPFVQCCSQLADLISLCAVFPLISLLILPPLLLCSFCLTDIISLHAVFLQITDPTPHPPPSLCCVPCAY